MSNDVRDRLTRREALRLGSAAAVSAALAACGAQQPAPAPAAAPTAAPAATSAPAATVAPQATRNVSVAPTAWGAPAAMKPGECTPNSGLGDIAKLTDTKVEMSGWAPSFNPSVPEMINWNQQVFFQKMEELTNVKINWTHGSADPQVNALALVMASGNLPDFIVVPYSAMNQYALEGAFEPIDSYMSKLTWLPKLLQERPQLKAYITAADGKMYHWPRCQQDMRLQGYAGMGIRKDWLDEAKLPVPTTMPELYEAMKAFKKGDAARFPMTGDPRFLIWQWGVGTASPAGQSVYDFAQEGGKVKYGPLEPGWKQAMAFLNRLFKEELMDPEYATKGTERVGQGLAGCVCNVESIPWQAKQAEYDKEAGNTKKWVAMHPPKGPRGHMQNPTTQAVSNYQTGGVVAKSAKNKELLMRFIDQYYSPSASQLMFMGTCGDTWSWDKDGKMAYSGRYLTAKVSGPNFVRTFLGPQAFGPMFVNATALTNWSGGYGSLTIDRRLFWAEEPNDMLVPDCIPFTRPENTEFRAKMGDITTLVGEYWPQFINGKKNLDQDYNDFVARLKSLGIEDATKLLQTGYDRFLASLKK